MEIEMTEVSVSKRSRLVVRRLVITEVSKSRMLVKHGG